MPKATTSAMVPSRYDPAPRLSRGAAKDNFEKGKPEPQRRAVKPKWSYPPPRPKRYVLFDYTEDWDVSKISALNEAPSQPTLISFGRDFNIEDEHLRAIAQFPTFCGSIVEFSAGDSDTGCGKTVSEAAWAHLAPLLISLERLSLDSHNSITGLQLFPILSTLPSLRYISVCGNGITYGKVDWEALMLLKSFRSIKEVELYDQPVTETDAVVVSHWCGGIRVKMGFTLLRREDRERAAYVYINGKPCSKMCSIL